MKVAIYITEERRQIVLTPENNWEIHALEGFETAKNFHVYRGEFYACQGGWDRQGVDNDSYIIVFDEKSAGK